MGPGGASSVHAELATEAGGPGGVHGLIRLYKHVQCLFDVVWVFTRILQRCGIRKIVLEYFGC